MCSESIYNSKDMPITKESSNLVLGLMPQQIHKEQRILNIIEAVHRYLDASKGIPPEWYREFQSLTGQSLIDIVVADRRLVVR